MSDLISAVNNSFLLKKKIQIGNKVIFARLQFCGFKFFKFARF